MIIGVTEWGAVKIYEDLTAVLRVWGKYKVDLLSDVIMLFEPDGRRYEPHCTYKRNRLLFWRESIVDFELKLSNVIYEGGDSLLVELNDRAIDLEKSDYFSTLDELIQYVRNEHAGT